MSKILFKNVKIVDGTGGPGYMGHVVVYDSQIHEILEEIPDVDVYFDEFIEGEGLVLSPGFIDSHSHSDLLVFRQAMLKAKLHQGITTEILGQDGVSVSPLPSEYVMDWRNNLSDLDGDFGMFNWNFKDVKDYLTAVDNTTKTSNFMYLIPHGNVRLSVMGFDDREPSPFELDQMKVMVKEAMEVGCPGMSAGLMMTPGAFAQQKELIELCKVVADYDGVFVVHLRSEAGGIIEALEEVLMIAEASGVRLHIAHFRLCGRQNWHLMDQVTAHLDAAKRRGITMTFDLYPYTAGSSLLSAIVPPWVREDGVETMLARLRDRELQGLMMDEIGGSGSKWDNIIAFAGADGIYITDIGADDLKWCVGKNLEEIGERLEMSPVEGAFHLLYKAENDVQMIDFYGAKDHVDQLIQRPESTVCTDALLGGKANPRVYGAFPKVIQDYVTREKTLTLEEAVRKMTSQPADIFGLKYRGRIAPGMKADLIMFDEKDFRPTNSYDDPHSYPEGLKLVMINGKRVYDGEVWHMNNAGEMLLKAR